VRLQVKPEHLQKVAGIFAGDEANGQMALFTDLYDFSHLPIETLSVVYEQFLHHKEDGDDTSEGEESGAYYTPVCLADFMIEEMDRKLPLRDGVAVFDPACGSGAFLVQAYRRLSAHTSCCRHDWIRASGDAMRLATAPGPLCATKRAPTLGGSGWRLEGLQMCAAKLFDY